MAPPSDRPERTTNRLRPALVGLALLVVAVLRLIRFPDDHFRKPYHEPARRLSEAGFRIAKRSSGNRMITAIGFSPGS
ncbi:hypothetical protein [Methylobacterium sp. ID0610]|uniref:hypothetical protein n=1 Tax=Methylobacterium carpenticola TaxID=3344827 RepID=UPI0036CFC44D